MNLSESKKDTISVNHAIWDRLYQNYQKDVDVPGVKYPNEHLVRFMVSISKSGQKNRKAVELGFGNITNMAMMTRYGFQVLGLEVSRESVERAKRAIQTRGFESQLSVQTFAGSVLPLPDTSVDLIVGLQCVYYNLDQKTFARECARVLKPGGKIFFSLFSPRHGYMCFIEGGPGGIVRFTKDHPNERLHGLELFLFRSNEQFEEIYGPYFELAIGEDEFDTEPLFMSWTYLAGCKKDNIEGFDYPIAFPAEPPPKTGGIPSNLQEYEKQNRQLWEKKYTGRYAQGLHPGNQYPNEHCIRFLANKNRGGLSSFYKDVGREDSIRESQNEKVLEVMPENCSNLLMAAGFGYEAFGLTFSAMVAERSEKFLKKTGPMNVKMHSMKNDTFPFENGFFDFVMTEKAGSHTLDQHTFVKEIARVAKPGGKIFIGYLTPRHGYLKHANPLGGGYFQIRDGLPDPTMAGMVLFIPDHGDLVKIWGSYFNAEVKRIEFSIHRYFSSFHFVKGVRL